MQLETRTTAFEVRTDEDNPRRLVGTAVVYRSPSDLGRFVEIIEPGALSRTLSEGRNIRALVEHDRRALLASTQAGTLKLTDTDAGLRVEIDVAETSYGKDLLYLVQRGEIRGMSFAFRVAKGGQKFIPVGERGATKPTRVISDLDLFEVTATATPAYEATDIAKRSIDANDALAEFLGETDGDPDRPNYRAARRRLYESLAPAAA